MTATKYCKGPTRKGFARPKIGLKAKWRMLGASRFPAVALWKSNMKKLLRQMIVGTSLGATKQ